MIIVSNTSPISNLIMIDQIGLLQKIYAKVLIPQAVYRELLRFSPLKPTVVHLLEIGWLEVWDVNMTDSLFQLQQLLDSGEAAAIELALQAQADRLLIDERKGRKVALELGLKVRGILGLLVKAKQSGLIITVDPFLQRLEKEAGFRVSRVLYDRILAEANE